MKTEETMNRICPVCGREYHEPPALSRADNQTLICPDCGVWEALNSIGVGEAEQGRNPWNHPPGGKEHRSADSRTQS